MEIKEHLTIVSPEQIMEPLLALLDEAPAVPLVISGSSMTPFLVPRRDTVYLSKISGPLKRGDMVLYQRSNGRYILHRILRAGPDSYTMVGDAQTKPEHGIRREQILAIVTAVRRKGRLLQKGSFWWDFFASAWIRAVPLRPSVMGLYRLVKHPGGRKKSGG